MREMTRHQKKATNSSELQQIRTVLLTYLLLSRFHVLGMKCDRVPVTTHPFRVVVIQQYLEKRALWDI